MQPAWLNRTTLVVPLTVSAVLVDVAYAPCRTSPVLSGTGAGWGEHHPPPSRRVPQSPPPHRLSGQPPASPSARGDGLFSRCPRRFPHSVFLPFIHFRSTIYFLLIKAAGISPQSYEGLCLIQQPGIAPFGPNAGHDMDNDLCCVDFRGAVKPSVMTHRDGFLRAARAPWQQQLFFVTPSQQTTAAYRTVPS